MKKVKMLVSLGTVDQSKYDVKGDCSEGKTIKVNERQFEVLVGMLKCAVPVDEPAEEALRVTRPVQQRTASPRTPAAKE